MREFGRVIALADLFMQNEQDPHIKSKARRQRLSEFNDSHSSHVSRAYTYFLYLFTYSFIYSNWSPHSEASQPLASFLWIAIALDGAEA